MSDISDRLRKSVAKLHERLHERIKDVPDVDVDVDKWIEEHTREEREKDRERFRRYRAANPERAREKSRRYYAANPEKKRESNRQYALNNPDRYLEKTRRASYKHLYNITLEDKSVMLEAQGYKCAIPGCGKPIDMTTGHVDHNHETRQVRALLCRDCNLMLGNAHENRDILLSAISYLDRYNGQPQSRDLASEVYLLA